MFRVFKQKNNDSAIDMIRHIYCDEFMTSQYYVDKNEEKGLDFSYTLGALEVLFLHCVNREERDYKSFLRRVFRSDSGYETYNFFRHGSSPQNRDEILQLINTIGRDETKQAYQYMSRYNWERKDQKALCAFLIWDAGYLRDERYRYTIIGRLLALQKPKRYWISHVEALRDGIAHRSGDMCGLPSDMIEDAKAFLRKYTPDQLRRELDRHVVGQEDAKLILAQAIYNHFLRLVYPQDHLIKSNILLIGPTGCGKTELIRQLDKLLHGIVPVVVEDFSTINPTP